MIPKNGKIGLLSWRVFPNRETLGIAAAAYAEGLIAELQKQQQYIRMIFAAAPSQNEFIATLVTSPMIDWKRVTAFQMDEYIGIPKNAPQRFSNFLRTRIFERLPFRTVELINSEAENAEAECERYAALLNAAAIDVCCLGIGENGHIAFNDPPVADFSDPKSVKIVALEEACRQQQVNDGCFANLSGVPSHAITLTIPMLMSSKHLVCCVPSSTKRDAVRRLLTDAEINTNNPATAMRRHPSAFLFLDSSSAAG